MENEEMIRRDMEETRTSMTEKLETLENKVAQTVHDATSAVSETVENIKDTVASVKDSVQETVSAVTEGVKEGVHSVTDTVKDAFDLPGHVDRHPWLAVGGSVGLGFLLGNLFGPRRTEVGTGVPAVGTTPNHGTVSKRQHTNGGTHKRRPESTGPSWLSQFGPEIAKLQGLALGTLFGAIREMAVQALPEHLGGQLKEIINSATQKLGGEPIPSSDWSEWASHPTEGDGHESDQERFRAKMGRPMGPTRRQG